MGGHHIDPVVNIYVSQRALLAAGAFWFNSYVAGEAS